MKKFRDLDCFMGAANLSDKPQDKIDIMTQAAGVVDENSRSSAIMFLAELLMQNGKKEEMSKQLEKISIDKLRAESATDFLKMLMNCGNIVKFTQEYKKAMELHPKDFAMHRTIFETLLENGQEILALDTYNEWWTAKGDPVAGYFYAKTLGLFAYRSIDATHEDAIPIYKKVTDMNPLFFDAFLELGYLYTMERSWENAEHSYSECVRIKPDDRNARYLLAFAKERSGKGEEAVDEYEKYLRTLNLQSEEIAAGLIDIALKLEKPERAQKYLEELGKSPKYADEHKVQTIKFKLIYGKPNDNDFADPYPKAARKFHEYYLLSKGRNNDVLLMPIPPDEFPDFWKLFILWKNNKPGWQEGANTLIMKNKNEKDATYRIIADMWNGKKTPDEARKFLNKVHPDNEPLFLLMLAEKYRKDNVASKAKVCYQKAASERQSPLVAVIDFYAQIPIKLGDNTKLK
jgi:tetratricopeptide (TPR) repeat protein